MAVHQFGRATPGKRVKHAHAGNENASGNLAFIDAHRGGSGDVDIQPTTGPLPGTFFADAVGCIWTEHWPTPKKMGYRYIVRLDGRGTRRLTRAELNRVSIKWQSAAFARLREGPSVNSRGPIHLDRFLRRARDKNFQTIPEVKRPQTFARARWADLLVAVFKHNNTALWPMVLADRKGLTAFVRAMNARKVIPALIGGKKAQGRKRNLVAMFRRWRARKIPNSNVRSW